MPFKSKKQQKYMNAAADRGEIPQKTVDKYNKSTDFSKLPERVKKKKGHEKRATRDETISLINETLRSKRREELLNKINRGS